MKKSAVKKALEAPEILEEIFWQSGDRFATMDLLSSSELYRYLQVSKLWSGPAIKLLWRHLARDHNLFPLMYMHPSRAGVTDIDVRVNDLNLKTISVRLSS